MPVEPQTTREQRLEAALRLITDAGPGQEPKGTVGCGSGGAGDDWGLGWDQCHWRMAQIAQEALGAAADGGVRQKTPTCPIEETDRAGRSRLNALLNDVPAGAPVLHSAADKIERLETWNEELRTQLRGKAREVDDLRRRLEQCGRDCAVTQEAYFRVLDERDAARERGLRLEAALGEALDVIADYLAYEHDGDPTVEDARLMGEMGINEYAESGALARARELVPDAE